MNETSMLRTYLNDIEKYPTVDKEEADEILKTKNPEGVERLINGCLKMVVSVVNKIMPYRFDREDDFMDLVQAGNIGLFSAVETFDQTKGNKFSTHAYRWVKSKIKEQLTEQRNGLIQKPKAVVGAVSLVNRVCKRFESKFGREPSEGELKACLKDIYSPERVEELLKIRNITMLSLDARKEDDEEKGSLADCISDNMLDEEMKKRETSMILEREVKVALPEKLASLICMRYGLGEFTDTDLSFKEIAELFMKKGLSDRVMSKQRMQQMEIKALGILKKSPRFLELFSKKEEEEEYGK